MIKIYVDGCRKMSGRGGYGYLIFVDGKIIIGGGHKSKTTNNVMELMGPIQALCVLNAKKNNINEQIEIISDSKYFVDGFNSWMAKWQRNGWTKQGGDVKNLSLWQALFQFSQSFKIKAKWVRGHNGHKENELCDEIANKCCASIVNMHGEIPDTGRLLGAHSLTQFMVHKTNEAGEPAFGRMSRRDPNGETFLRMLEDGRIVVKDGRSLDEYLNHPIQLASRQKLGLGEIEICIVSKKFFEDAIIPHYS